ncbi:MAG: InlB B-repeat-containing protein [Bacteroidales bacterium]
MTASAGANGSIDPSGAVTVNQGSDPTFTITPNTGYDIADVLVNGSSVGPVSSYTFNNVAGDSTISASFVLKNYIISATAGANGSIDPSGNVSVEHGANQTFNIIPATNYQVDRVFVDGVNEGSITSYTFTNVTEDHTISATFTAITHTITATAGANGSIDPSGAVTVNQGSDPTFNIIPNTGYDIADVLVNGTSVGPVSSYTFSNVSGDSTITASFVIKEYTITATAGENGSIDPSGNVSINHGASQTFTITPDPGYQVSNVLVNGLSVGTPSTYTFSNVTANQSIVVSFEPIIWTIEASSGPHGTIDPTGTVIVNEGSDQSFSFIPETGYEVDDVIVDGVSQGPLNTYTFNNVDQDHTISVTFVKATYIITATAGANGSISPSGDVEVSHGSNQSFTITPDVGYEIDELLVDGSSVPVSLTYTFSDVTTTHTISVSFKLRTYTITAIAGLNGIITPSGDVVVDHGSEQSFTIIPATGYEVEDVLVDGTSVGTVTNYSFTNVTENHTISVSFILKTYTITATAGVNGTISPAGNIEVDHGANQIFVITPDEGYEVDDVLVDGVSVGAVEEYTFTNVTEVHAISATFILKTYTITATSDANGSIDPSGEVVVDHGTDQIFTFTPNTGYEVEDVLVNGVSVGPSDSYTFLNVTENQTISVSFKLQTFIITSSTGLNGTIAPLGDTEVTWGTDQAYTITPDEGYEVEDVLVDGLSIGAVEEYVFTNVTEDHTISVSFILKTYIITSSTGPNGTITPLGETEVDHGSDLLYTITPDEGYEVEDVLIDGISVGPLAEYTFTNITEPHTISVSFILKTYLVSASAGLNGSIDPVGDTLIDHGSSITYTFTPDEGYEIEDVLVDGISIGIVPFYTFENVTEEHTISVSFIIKTYNITALGGQNGAITPEGDTLIEHGSSITYTFLPDEGYEVEEVIVDGVSLGPLDEYIFENVTEEHTLLVSFILKTYIISVSYNEYGTVTPGVDTEVDHGSDLEFTFEADEGYEIADVIVDGFSVGTPESYLFADISEAHTIEVEFIKLIEISGVVIPNLPMSIGDTVTATLFVTTDVGFPYDLGSGNIGGYPLFNIERVNFTTYTADFTITAGGNSYTPVQSIPVSNLVLTDGDVLSDPYDDIINQNNDPIDAKPPQINFVWVESGNKRVGETVRLIINADGVNYTVDTSTTINYVNVTENNVYFNEIGTGTYSIEYVVMEGDTNVNAGELTASIVLIKPSGNINDPYTTVNNSTQLTIDANSPDVIRMEVPSEEFGIGEVVEVTITADGEGYNANPATVINEIPLSSSRVSFVEESGGIYTLSYVVAIGDNTVLPGDLEVNLILNDEAGNTGGPFTQLQPNTLSVFTELPTATIAGTQTICDGDPAVLTVYLTGRAPWSIFVSDGNTTKQYTNIPSSPFEITVNPVQSATYRIDLVSDVNGTLNSGTGSATVTVRERTEVEIINLKTNFSIESEPVQLEASIEGGVFSGPGVNSATGIFNPAAADTVNSPHTIYYSYENNFGCISRDSALVFVLGAHGDVYIPRNFYCDYQDPFTATASNTIGATGSYTLLNSDEEEVAGLTDNGDNTATIDPSVLETGRYTVVYGYFDGIMLYLRENFMVESIEQPQILVPGQDEFCLNEPAIELSGSMPTAVFAGPGVSGDIVRGFVFDPSKANIGNNAITLTNTSMDGCSKSDTQVVVVNQVPPLSFETDKLCVSSMDTIFFENTTPDRYLFESWEWNFGDPESGDDNISTGESARHIYNESGPRTITLIGQTVKGCYDTLTTTMQFGESPKGSFTWDNECFDESAEVTFTSNMTSTTPITTYEWTFIDPEGNTFTRTGSPEVEYTFDSLDVHTVQLYTETDLGCTQMVEREIMLKPVITPGDERYLEQFTMDNGYWETGQSDSSEYNSWDYNMINFDNLGMEISRGWYTDLPDQPVNEYSWVTSPCFNFTETERPMIFMDIYRSLERNLEGVVLQASTDVGQTWESVGEMEDGINWYNSTDISLLKTDSTGWTGVIPFAPDERWVSARHDLDKYAGEENVQFRVLFASTHGSTEEGRQGFAFDNVIIGSRNRQALIEHFTNTAAPDTREVNGEVNSLYNLNYDDVVKLEYHTSFPGQDPFNQHNPSVPAIRALYYGVTSVPYSILDGGYQPSLKYDYKTRSLSNKDIKNATLMDGIFDIDLTTEYTGDNVFVEVDVTALRNLNAEERIVHIVVFEKLITDVPAENGARNFLNVVKAMLPNAAGTAELSGWAEGQTRTYQHSWDFANVYDPEMIRIAAFIQNDNSKEVYQVVVDDSTNLTTSDKPWDLNPPGIDVYPNPATDFIYVNVNVPDRYRTDYVIEILDQVGRVVVREDMFEYEDLKQVGLDDLNKGVYFVRVKDENEAVVSVTKVVIMN